MIRINLLGSPKPKGKKSSGPALSMPSFELGSLGGPMVQVAAVLLIAGAEPTACADTGADGYGGALDKALAALLKELPLKQAARLAAQITGARDNEAYKRALLLKEQLASQ